jgi:Ser/Thr protein kinase RdoA (MazF antagonist)
MRELMTLFDFFESVELPVPAITTEQAADIAAKYFGVQAHVTALGSQQDANFLLHDLAGVPVGVLKIANPVFSRIELEAQDAASAFIAAGEGIRTATNIELAGSSPIAQIDGEATLFPRIITYLAGGTLSGDAYLRPTQVAALGALAGRSCRALAEFDHPGVDRVMQWDMRHGIRTVEVLAEHVTDTRQREIVEAAAAQAWQLVAELTALMVRRMVHTAGMVDQLEAALEQSA